MERYGSGMEERRDKGIWYIRRNLSVEWYDIRLKATP